MVRRIYDLCIKAGIPCEMEPRPFSSYRCLKCNEVVEGERKSEHQRTCGSPSFHRSGPDLAIYWATGIIYYDFTILHEFAPSNAGRSGAQLMRDAIKKKHATYVKTGLIPFEQFKCIPMLSGGALHSGTKILLNSLADCGAAYHESS